MICYKCTSKLNAVSAYGLHPECFSQWFKHEGTAEFRELDPQRKPSKKSSPEFKKKDTFLHGQYLKYSAKLGTTDFILKIQEPEFPELPASEFLCNQIARALQIKVPDFFLISFNGLPTFVTRNFMQDHVGTLHHIYKFLPPGEEHHSCKEISRCILEQTGRLADVSVFAEFCLYDGFIGNNDRHGRNIGIIETMKGKFISPMYDNPSYLGIVDDFMLEAHFSPSGSVWTSKTQEPKLLDYINEFVDLGHSRAVELFKNRVLSKSSEIFGLVEHSFLTPKRKKAFISYLEARVGEIENA